MEILFKYFVKSFPSILDTVMWEEDRVTRDNETSQRKYLVCSILSNSTYFIDINISH